MRKKGEGMREKREGMRKKGSYPPLAIPSVAALKHQVLNESISRFRAQAPKKTERKRKRIKKDKRK